MSKNYSHRFGKKSIKVADGGGKEVIVRQISHSFLFGCSEFSTLQYASGEMDEKESALARKRYDHMAEIFNSVTLPFYWGRYEPQQGNPDTYRMEKAAKYLKDRGMKLKGHPLCWHTVCANWLLEMSNEDILKTQLERVRRDITYYKGLIDMWDVINEAVIMPIFDKYDNAITRICKDKGRIKLIKELFKIARDASPGATLLINDFDTSESYDILVEGLLEAGVPIDVIGIQSHMHQGYWGLDKTKEVLSRFSRFGLPLHFTEVSLVSGEPMPPEIVDLNDFQTDSWETTPEGEKRQALEIAEFYDTLFAEPLVESITYWNFHDGLWLNAPSGLLTKNCDPKPAYNELHKRIKGDWYSGEQKIISNQQGFIDFTGIKGDYAAVCEDREISFTV